MLGEWKHQVDELAERFRTAEPYPVLVIDGFLEPEAAEALLSEFPAISAMKKSGDYIFGEKYESAALAGAGAATKGYHDLLLSDEFADVLKRLTGRELFVDSSFHGGGFHQGGDGSYLDTHVDFNIHPDHSDWLRVLNILLFLNKDWKEDFGGDLLLRTDPSAEPRAIAPLFNRGVIMVTDDHTYHGYHRMTLPPGTTRKSIAAYAYEPIAVGSIRARTTSWAPEGAGLVKRTLGRHWGELASLRHRARSKG